MMNNYDSLAIGFHLGIAKMDWGRQVAIFFVIYIFWRGIWNDVDAPSNHIRFLVFPCPWLCFLFPFLLSYLFSQ